MTKVVAYGMMMEGDYGVTRGLMELRLVKVRGITLKIITLFTIFLAKTGDLLFIILYNPRSLRYKLSFK